MPSGDERGRPFWAVMLITVVLDRITKIIAERMLGERVVSVIGDAVQFRLVHNQGAAFGLDLGLWQRWIFLAIAIAAIVWLYLAARQASPADRLRQLAVAFVAGGAAGNAIDRVLSARGVIDFIDIGAGTLRWPTFNVADIAVTCGAIALALSLWREDARRAAATRAAA
ncbi:MAG TPA: signal peptidase II [Gemmatimonadales bacterium]|jgi:signal peptidase II